MFYNKLSLADKERYQIADKNLMHAIVDSIIDVPLSLNEVNRGVAFIDEEFKKDVDAVAANMRNLFASKLRDVSSWVTKDMLATTVAPDTGLLYGHETTSSLNSLSELSSITVPKFKVAGVTIANTFFKLQDNIFRI
ncbi:hypothetical protein ROZALSC1DRAFT_26404, partial [Rozella allomycis CSF55]